MGRKQELLDYLNSYPPTCDDCLTPALGVTQRQTVFGTGKALHTQGLIGRGRGTCTVCGKIKKLHVRLGLEAELEPLEVLPLRAAAMQTSRPRRPIVLNGSEALERLVAVAGYETLSHAVAEHTVFLHPDTVVQTRGQAMFPIIRASLNSPRGRIESLPDGRQVWADDNGPATNAFLWASGCGKGPDVQYNHVWSLSKDPDLYTALWNLCATPAFLAKTTDTHPEVQALLKYRSYQLYGYLPAGMAPPQKPASYETLRWAPFPSPLEDDLEQVFRREMRSKPKAKTTVAARTLGWVFSGNLPDSSL